MTNKEIVKAWIVVIKNKRMPTEYLINVTIDRINSLTAEVLRQQAEINVKKRLLDKAEAEIEELKTSNFQFISNINAYKAEIEMDDVEIKELRIALQGYLDDLTKERNLYKKSIEELNQAKAENERLKTNLNIELENYATEYDNKIKAEAYREFAERVKLEFYYEFDELIPSIMSDRIDNLLKELVGEDDG